MIPRTDPFFHTVCYELPKSVELPRCDLSTAKMIANATQGEGRASSLCWKRWQPYYFAWREHAASNLPREGRMKFHGPAACFRRWHY
ncbi:hypothetical protein CUMW_185300 [Citrus unshiu]|nr:hypothetical protein CUMW_185300 [Citrus unshiu]